MTKKFVFLAIILGLATWGCSGKASKGKDGSEANSEISKQEKQPAASSSEFESLSRNEFANKLHGHWYLDEYLNLVEETKSVWKASQETGEVLVAGFSKEQLMSEKPMVEGASAHEGGFVAFLDWDDSAHTFTTIEGEHNYFADKSFSLKLLSDTMIAIELADGEDRKFRKIAFPEDVNDMLFTGRYSMSDGRTISFTSEGELKGHPDFVKFEYNVVSDFFEIPMDAIRVISPGGESQFFHYVFEENGFTLYEIVGNMGEGFTQGDQANYFERTGNSSSEQSDFVREISGVSTNYFDLPAESEDDLRQILKTDDLTSLNEPGIDVMGDYLKRTVLAGNSQFGPFIGSNYFWYVYNALPDFVAEGERHKGYYRGQNDQPMQQKLLAYSIYRIDRRPENIEKIFQYVKPFLKGVISPEKYSRMGIDRKLRGLLDSYQMISEIEDYKKRLSDAYAKVDTMTGTIVSYDGHEEFRKFENSAYGFSVYELNEFVMKELIPDVDRFHSMPEGLSFWMRRSHEGNIDEVHEILKEIEEIYKY